MTKYTLTYAPVQKRNEGDPEYKPVEYVVFATGTPGSKRTSVAARTGRARF